MSAVVLGLASRHAARPLPTTASSPAAMPLLRAVPSPVSAGVPALARSGSRCRAFALARPPRCIAAGFSSPRVTSGNFENGAKAARSGFSAEAARSRMGTPGMRRGYSNKGEGIVVAASAVDGDSGVDNADDGYGGAGPRIGDIQNSLDNAVAREDFTEAARLRDQLRVLKGNSAAAVTDANDRFYHAFRTSDAKGMRGVWGTGDHVQCLHPGAACISGSEQVMASWEIVFGSLPTGTGLDVSVEQLRVHASQGWGFVTCVEKVESDTGVGKLAATNVFEMQDGEW
eukprot:CAMPEP_0198706350 /NCGR_PEP_ID=MMETSP1468-20131203/390919_1 /TAXON_ID=1461545 /ORGANISM="Mantoniella sp, Strain CCMP1436" /LENGTH=285 /DNA_ID=CAMNT_0044465285 /DNA_START=877 /DNA_END=1731 /DNA_ORIENTATION=-